MRKLVMLAALMCFCLSPLFSQDMQPEKFPDSKLIQITYMKFHPGKMGRAMEIVRDYFMKASVQSGTRTPMMAVNMMTGEWDMMVVWESDISDLEWRRSPDGIKWQKALNELAGGADKARELQEEYGSTIAASTSDMGRKRNLN
ncbi:hypothetical protein [Fulvivirga sedimenti]|uniref:NIPSNAP domain-containing protein n=1 Tax=Fulvivirga sedimenti TaxID=2879465 RepID=A0A9X1HUV4_9BACT|nr:hypothetical protein [Fulvivirga sedimenti]MCA6074927.1 hypothetical protein [Fulvivirga sedimenti]MCA6076104.1 hypothetical protein [Fulvivirga sedimenti]MCA6077232.1 hypothetical protein [Fulvivirga sedimenti]